MSDDAFEPLDAWLRSALVALGPGERKKLMRSLGQIMRRRNQARMARHMGPDGERWPMRKRNNRGRIRTAKKMMVRLRDSRRMMLVATADGVEVGWRGHRARVAAVHHYGRTDTVSENGSLALYAARPLLGLPAADRKAIRSTIIEALRGIR
ncbi:phage virion morphogenesis protein [Haematospirillum jordaniae]|uniref:Phage virion morphogenesis protein n=1 Tax=Haematospirillum jordaniae TaxID=1549855 RepID=A0A143DH82_9PROT|nr:phage virion morphogenesis protein [Haematospirillum jordaniae]AMW35703.1 hypothetical protein AY555_09980 [Haematospirillum jordaniae]NKD46013.1 phage virion morphogenesis protein [Haematospirillum jordaniae]NKD60154.1 phage virion morphogenesis protein [Haematospirillum jordaniae]NKD68030.1 phage virion morphogenesis protein [Haematospirillum jordaniae]NKD82203.1 phage virion morphogenesis protein [Haematospirillum jordaniae]